jgi:single-strand DNA-binding protein
MSEGLNRVMLLGNLGADPDLRQTQGGQAVLHLRLATTESYLDKDKVRRERTDWHNVVVWGKRGEALSKILTKGSTVFVEGSLRTSSYDDRDGNKRYKTEVIANNIILTGKRGAAPADAQGDGAPQERRERGQGQPPADDEAMGGGYGGDDDVPFAFVGAAPEGDGIPRSWL